MEQIQHHISNYEGWSKKMLIARLTSNDQYIRKKWVDSQPKDKVFEYGRLSESPTTTMECIRKTIDELSESEIDMVMPSDLIRNYTFNEQ